MLGSDEKHLLDCEVKPLKKMVKSICAAAKIQKGDLIRLEDLCFKVPQGGLLASQVEAVVGCIAHRDYQPDDWIEIL